MKIMIGVPSLISIRLFVLAVVLCVAFAFAANGQNAARIYEVEMLMNPNAGGKDTREINSVLVFEKDSIKVISRRNKKPFAEIPYSDITSVEHSYSKGPAIDRGSKAFALALLGGYPLLMLQKEKHWLTLVSTSNFVVLKIENDNFRMIKAEFQMRRFAVKNVNETRTDGGT